MSSVAVWQLSDEVLVHIFSFLPAEDVGRVAGVCSRWARVAEDRRVWRGKVYMAEGSCWPSDALPVVRALPVLKSVSICGGGVFIVYFSGESASFQVPDLRDEVVVSTISSVVTENLSIDFCLLDDKSSNCLVVQLHRLQQLGVGAFPTWMPRATAEAKLRALGRALSSDPVPNLRSVSIRTGTLNRVETDILGMLATCPALEQLTLECRCTLAWPTGTRFSKLQSLTLLDCVFEDISFLESCPNLRSVCLASCTPQRSRELSRKLNLRSLSFYKVQLYPKFLETLFQNCPELEKIVFYCCRNITDFWPSRPSFRFAYCPVQTCLRTVGVLHKVKHLGLLLSPVVSDALGEILKCLPRLEVLDIAGTLAGSLRFLRHCAGLSELSLGPNDKLKQFCELGGLANLQKLQLCYGDANTQPLAEALHKMPRLEALDLKFSRNVSDLSFLRHSRHLRSLTLQFGSPADVELSFLNGLVNLKELRKFVVTNLYFRVELLEGILSGMPMLEELDIEIADTECDLSFLRHCPQLACLQISLENIRVWDIQQLRRLKHLRRLTVAGLSETHAFGGQLPQLALAVQQMPRLEHLGLVRGGPNVLESWEWCRILMWQRSNP